MRAITVALSCVALSSCCPALAHDRVTDEAAITKILTTQGRVAHTSPDLDWENAFGRRFRGLENMLRFRREQLAPTISNAVDETTEVRINFITDDVAVADQYWTLKGQTDDSGKVLADRRGRDTYVFTRHEGRWLMIVQRIADLRS